MARFVLIPAVVVGLAGCGSSDQGEAEAFDEPVAALKEYVNRLNSGDYAGALSLVADSDVDPAGIVRFYDEELPEPLLAGEQPSGDVESASLQVTVGGEEREVSVVKGGDGWQLAEPEFLIRYDLNFDGYENSDFPGNYGEAQTVYGQVGELETFTSNGDPLPPEGFYLATPSMLEDGEAPTAEWRFTGRHGVPDQEHPLTFQVLEEGGLRPMTHDLNSNFDIGDLASKARSLAADELSYFHSYTDPRTVEYVVQQFAYASDGVGECTMSTSTSLLSDEEINEGVLRFSCEIERSGTDSNNRPPMTEFGTEWVRLGNSKDPLCAYREYLPGAENQGPIQDSLRFFVKDRALVADWGAARFDESHLVDDCGGTEFRWGGAKVGDVFQGTAPSPTAAEDTIVSTSLE